MPLGLALVVLGILSGPVAAEAALLELAQARVSATASGTTTTRDVQLPYHWDANNPGQQGEAVFDLSFTLPDVPQNPWSLYLPRLGNAYEIWLNGTLLQREGDLQHYNGADYSQEPRYAAIPPGLLQASNQVRVHIRADAGRRGGLSRLTLGPQDEVDAAYRKAYLWRGTGSLVIAGLSLLVGLMALSLWLTQVDATARAGGRRDPLYLSAALAELLWSFGVGYALIEAPPLPWPWWGVLPVMASGGWMVNMMLFCVEVAGWRAQPAVRWLRRALAVSMVCGVGLVLWALGGGQPLALTVWYATMSLLSLGFSVVFLWRAVGPVPVGHRVVAVTLLANVLVGMRDLYVYRIHPSYGEITWIRYSSVLFGLALGYIVVTRFRAASAQARNLLSTLENRVAQKEAELKDSYEKLELLARQQERTAERTRILRDMHDGVGAHISSAIHQLQGAQGSRRVTDNQEVLQTLRDALDQLKLSIDAMHLPPGDITALLANLRYRLEPRLQASDMALQWSVELLEPIGRLDDKAMRQLQFMVYEALSNILQHSQAKLVHIEAMRTPEGVRLRVADNGRGFDVSVPHRRGLMSMRDRAAAIGALLRFQSQPGATVVEILIP
ncbi:MAG: ATP-binding protein [Rhodoferax sp.]